MRPRPTRVEVRTWRQLTFDDPVEGGLVTLDFNSSITMWFAYTDHATCPAPVEGDPITVPVRPASGAPIRT